MQAGAMHNFKRKEGLPYSGCSLELLSINEVFQSRETGKQGSKRRDRPVTSGEATPQSQICRFRYFPPSDLTWYNWIYLWHQRNLGWVLTLISYGMGVLEHITDSLQSSFSSPVNRWNSRFAVKIKYANSLKVHEQKLNIQLLLVYLPFWPLSLTRFFHKSRAERDHKVTQLLAITIFLNF